MRARDPLVCSRVLVLDGSTARRVAALVELHDLVVAYERLYGASPPSGRVFILPGRGAEVVCERTCGPGEGDLVGLALDALAAAGAAPDDLDTVVAGTGPGLPAAREALVAAEALAGEAAGRPPVVATDSLDAVAADAAGQDGFVVVADAGRGRVHWAPFSERGTRCAPTRTGAPGALADLLRSRHPLGPGRYPDLVGAGARLHAALFEGIVVDRGYAGPGPLAVRGPGLPSPLGLVATVEPALRAALLLR